MTSATLLSAHAASSGKTIEKMATPIAIAVLKRRVLILIQIG